MFLVTNRAPGGRGFNIVGGTTVYLEPGETRPLNLTPIGVVEKAWVKAGEVEIEPIPEPEPAEEGGQDGDQGEGDPQGGQAKPTTKAKG